MFRDRTEAGKLLATRLRKFKDLPEVVLAVPRGGVPIGYEVAKELGCPLDIILAKKLGHPRNKEYAIGAVSLYDRFVIPHDDVSQEYIESETERIRERLLELRQKMQGDREPVSMDGKIVIVVDDGIATGNTMLGTIEILRKSNPAKIVIAVPVASHSAIHKLSHHADEIISLMVPEVFYGVGGFYQHFQQVSDEEVLHLLKKIDKYNHGHHLNAGHK